MNGPFMRLPGRGVVEIGVRIKPLPKPQQPPRYAPHVRGGSYVILKYPDDRFLYRQITREFSRRPWKAKVTNASLS